MYRVLQVGCQLRCKMPSDVEGQVLVGEGDESSLL